MPDNARDELQDLEDIAHYGIEVEAFLNQHPIGKLLLRRAQDQLERAQRELVNVSAADTPRVIALQQDARVALCFIDWLAECINDGRAATDQLRAYDDDIGVPGGEA